MADRKMTLKERAIRANMEMGERNEADEERWLAGWHARGRADRLTKAERAVVEAAVDWIEGDCDALLLIAAIHKLREERARRKA